MSGKWIKKGHTFDPEDLTPDLFTKREIFSTFLIIIM